jgi:integrase
MEFTQPRLNESKKGSDWFIWWKIRDSPGDAWQVVKFRGNINRIKTLREKRKYGSLLCQKMLGQLQYHARSETSFSGLKKGITVVLPELITSRKGSLRHRSYQSYCYAKDRFLKYIRVQEPSVLYMDEVTKQVALRFIESLYCEGLKGRSINNLKDILSILFNRWIANQHEHHTNPFKGIASAKVEAGKNIAFSDPERNRLWDYLYEKDQPLRIFTRFIFFTYIRPLELLRLQVGDFNLSQGEIILPGAKTKNRKQQSVVIPQVFYPEVIAMGLDKLPADWYIFGRDLIPGELPYGRNAVTSRHSVALKALKFSTSHTLYSWKHTGVVAAYRAGIDLYAIMRQLRHSSLDQTATYLKSLGLVRNTEFAGKMVG